MWNMILNDLRAKQYGQMKSRDGEIQRRKSEGKAREERRRKTSKRKSEESRSKKKKSVREEVGKSRNTVFFPMI